MILQAPVDEIVTPSIDWLAIAPPLAMFAAALVIVLGRALIRHDDRVNEAALLIAFAGVLVAGVFVFVQWIIVDNDGPYQAIEGMVAVDGFAVFIQTRRPARDAARRVPVRRLSPTVGAGDARVLRADAVFGDRHDADGVGQ